jgi:hypothetical protein
MPVAMEIVSACQLPVGAVVWRTWSGAVVLSVVCKGTFLLRSVESPLAEEQDPIVDADTYWNDDPREALRAASDLVPFKRRADVIVVGNAFAPSGDPVRSLRARVCVGAVDKTIEIYGDRVFNYQGTLREGSRFVKSPLLWRHAAGGPSTSNPVGIRHDAPWDTYGQRLLPRIQPPGLHVTGPEVIPAIGLGPIAPTWPERLEKLYAHAAGWDHRAWNQRPLPRDIDAAYFNAATADQQTDAIRPDERIVLENLHPIFSRLATNLYPVMPEAVVERPGQAAEAVPFLCDTMWIDSDRGVCVLSWRARIILAAPNAPGRVVVTLAGVPAGASIPAAAVPRPTGPLGSPGGPAPTPGYPTSAGAAAPSPAGATSLPPPPEDPFSIERCAAIAASCARRATETAAILAANNLTEDDWDAFEHRWAQVLKQDAQQGYNERLAAYDRAYVARLEEERGPFKPEEYARLALAHDRDKAALTRALRDLELPWGSSQRILRVFAERIAANPALAEQIRAAMAEP